MIQIMHEHSYYLNPPQEWFNQELTSYVQLEIEDNSQPDSWHSGDLYCDFEEHNSSIVNERIQEEHSYNLTYLNNSRNNGQNLIEPERYVDNFNDSSEDEIEINHNSLAPEHCFSIEEIQQIQQEHLYNLTPNNFKLIKNGELGLKKSVTKDNELSEESEPGCEDGLEMKQDLLQQLITETEIDTHEDSDIQDMDLSTFVRICQIEEKALREIDESFVLNNDLERMKD